MATGIIKRYDFRKGFGFIADENSGEDFFFHKSEWQGDGPIRKGLAVKFTDRDSEKGPQAESVYPIDGDSSTPARNEKPAPKPISLEGRIASLESAVATWKVLSILALAGVIALAIGTLVL